MDAPSAKTALHLQTLQSQLSQAPRSGTELRTALGVSQPTLSRVIQKSGNAVQAFGGRKNSLYARPRAIEGVLAPVPVFRIGPDGKPHSLGNLIPVHDRGFVFEDPDRRYEVFSGLPYYFEDLRPQGFLGRGFARRHPDLALPERPEDWSSDHVVRAVARRGETAGGNLIVGAESFDRWNHLPPDEIFPEDAYEAVIDRLGREAIGGSSAAGEQPKFTHGNRSIVKFSPLLDTPTGRRWSDLLEAERIALGVLGTTSRIVRAKTRCFFEIERFDRAGDRGRIGTVSLHAYALEHLRSPRNWSDAASELRQQRKIDEETRNAILLREAFGMLIANSDRHLGNLSFFWDLAAPGEKLRLTPAYDMLPMAFAPTSSGAMLPYGDWTIPKATAATLAVWDEARELALEFWGALSDAKAVSSEFRKAAEIFHREIAGADAAGGAR